MIYRHKQDLNKLFVITMIAFKRYFKIYIQNALLQPLTYLIHTEMQMLYVSVQPHQLHHALLHQLEAPRMSRAQCIGVLSTLTQLSMHSVLQ